MISCQSRIHVIKKGRMELDTDQLRGNKAHNTLRKANNKGYKTILARFLNSPRYRDSQTKIGWDEFFHFGQIPEQSALSRLTNQNRVGWNICAAYDAIASLDHSYITTRWERSRNENSWARVEPWRCKWTRGSARWLQRSNRKLVWQAVQRICSNSRICLDMLRYVNSCAEKMLHRYWKFQSQNVQIFQYVDQNTNGPNHGPVWKTQSFLLSEICTVILWQDYFGKGNSRKFFWNTVGRRFQIGDAYKKPRKKIILVCVCGRCKTG